MQDESTKKAEQRLVPPPWRCIEIIQKASEAIKIARLSDCHCDALTSAQKLGITARPYSSLNAEAEAFFFSGILIGLLLIVGIAELEHQVDTIVRETNNVQKFLRGFCAQKEAKAG